ncbi:MAG: hypothetical protein U9P61_00335 [Patescibacteria group bacterium]|nr:hypothetical protein [Patescibacteria group bacterium]
MKKIFKIFQISLLALFIPLVFLCIFQITGMTSEKKLTQQHQEEIHNILNEEMFSVLGEKVSLAEVEEVARQRDFIDAESKDIVYIKIPSNKVVVR